MLRCFSVITESMIFSAVLKPRVSEIAYHAIADMQITEREVKSWQSDVDLFVNDDFESGETHRQAAAELIRQLSVCYPNGIQGCVAAVMLRLREATERRKRGNPFWWKLREAALYALEAIIDKVAKVQGLLDIESMFASLCGVDCRCSTSSQLSAGEQFLLCRALSLAAAAGRVVRREVSLPLFQHAALTLASGTPMTIPKIGACKMIKTYRDHLSHIHT